MTIPDFLYPFGPLHIVFLHLPIGGLIAIWFVLFVLPNQGQKHKDSVIGLLHLFLVFSTALTIILGLAYEVYGQYEEELELHELWAYIFGGAVLVNFVLYWLHRVAGGNKTKLLYFLSLIVATVAMLVTAHQGGELVHGKGFLVKPFRGVEEAPIVNQPVAPETPAPQVQVVEVEKPEGGSVEVSPEMDDSMVEMGDSMMDMDMMAVPTPVAPVPEVNASTVSNESIELYEAAELVFKNNCYNCHGATKQKGNLRLDNEGSAFSGGDSGPVSIVPHDVEGSLVVERMRLPRDHDDAMPPEKKPPVSAEGIEAVVAWIQVGAIWPDMRERDKRMLKYVEIDDEQTAAIFEKVNAIGAKAEYNSWDDARVRVDLSFTDTGQLERAIELINGFGDKLIWLDVSGRELPKTFYKQINKFPNLERLHIDGTDVNDTDLKALSYLSKLSYLNLFDTRVTDDSVAALLALPSLQKVFLGESKVTKAGVQKLMKAKPDMEVIHQ
ncbi:MAG: c-type cytochrome domain-containing protein [Lentimonas sp.]